MIRIQKVILGLALPLLVLAGCNAFGGIGGDSNDPEALLQDANAALQDDNPDKAVNLLRKAVEHEGGNGKLSSITRTRLSTALLEKQDISIIDFVRIADKITNKTGSEGGVFGKRRQPEGECSFQPGQVQSSEEFDPTDIANFSNLEASEETLQEIQDLIDRVLNKSDTNPDEFTDENIQQAIDRLHDDGLTDEQIAEALLNDAVAYTSLAYIDIANSGGEDFSFYYVTPAGGGDQYPGYCTPDQATLDETLSSVACQVDGIGFAVDLVSARATLLESDRADQIGEKADKAYDRLTEELEATCSASPKRADASSYAQAVRLTP